MYVNRSYAVSPDHMPVGKTGGSLSAIVLCVMLLLQGMAWAIDYSDPARWISRPAGDKPVDVIYLYPTSWQATPSDPLYCEIDNGNMVGTATDVYTRQATAFEPVANVYAPFYRQMNITKTLGTMTNEELEQACADVPAKDVAEALDYYFANCNNGRPFILAGHSQGTQVMTVVMADYFKKHPELRERMVASYLIGYTVTNDFLVKNGFQFAAGADDTGVVLSWNTEAPGTTGSPVIFPGALAINPLNWKTDGTYAGADQNLGAYMPDSNGVYHLVPNFADAWINPDTGTINTNVDPSAVNALQSLFPQGSYHGYDYQFYYYNLMYNALTRSLTFLNRPQAALYSSSLRTGTHATRAFRNAVPSFRDRLLVKRDASATVAAADALASPEWGNASQLEIFASPFGGWMKQKKRDGYAGYDIDGGGIAVGAAKSWDAFTVGLVGGYSKQRTTMSGMDGQVDADMLHTAFFAGLDLGNFFLEGTAGYGRSWNDSKRSIPYGGLGTFSYSSVFRQNMWSASVGAGYIAELPYQLRLIPSITLDAVWVRTGKMKETGALAALQMEKTRYTSVELPISLMLEKRISCAGKTVAPWVEAAWIPELGDRRPSATMSFTGNSAAGTFRAAAAAAHSRGRVAAGVRGEVGRVSLNVGYTFEFSNSHTNHVLNAGIGMAF